MRLELYRVTLWPGSRHGKFYAYMADPTWGKIDRDIQWMVFRDLWRDTTAVRVAVENTMQDRRNRERGRKA